MINIENVEFNAQDVELRLNYRLNVLRLSLKTYYKLTRELGEDKIKNIEDLLKIDPEILKYNIGLTDEELKEVLNKVHSLGFKFDFETESTNSKCEFLTNYRDYLKELYGNHEKEEINRLINQISFIQ